MIRLRRTSPVFLVADVAATMDWYRENLGFDGLPFPEQPPHFFGIMTRDDVEIMLQQLDGYEKPDIYEQREGGVWNVYIRMEGVRELYEQVSKRPGVTLLEPLCEQEYGQIELVVRDPNGYTLVFAERHN
jgi:uncharacterized glyoxalase superfamily protein PhnB